MTNKLKWLFAVLLVLGFGNFAEATCTTYTVVKNDNLTKIAKRFYGDSNAYMKIADSNRISNPNVIHVGQPLAIGCNPQVQAQRVASQPVPTRTPAKVAPVEANDEFTVLNQVDREEEFSVIQVEVAEEFVVITKKFFDFEQDVVASVPGHSSRNRKKNARMSSAQILASRETREVIDTTLEIFGPRVAPTMLATMVPESGLDPRETGYNCYGWRWSWKKMRNERYGRACELSERFGPLNFSVDCGITQINVPGKQVCPPELFDIRTNLLIAKKKYDNGGMRHWVAHRKGKHVEYLPRYERLIATRMASGATNTQLVSMNQE